MVPANFVERRRCDRIFAERKILSLGLMTVILYTVVGFCLASLKVNLGFWSLGILLYHWQLANWVDAASDRDRQHGSIALTGLVGTAIAYLVGQAKSNLLPYHWLAIGLVATINSYVMTAIALKSWQKLGAIAFTTAVAWLGLLLGWTAYHYPGIA
jgi:hypothetical protein